MRKRKINIEYSMSKLLHAAMKAGKLFALLLLISNFSILTSHSSFEPLSVGARASGMAEAYTTIADDALSLYYNPAGMLHVRRPELSTYYSRLFIGLEDNSTISRSFMGYVHPLKEKWGGGSMGVSYINLALSSLYKEEAYGLSYARSITRRLNAGVTLKGLKKTIGSDRYTENAIDDTGFALGAPDPLFNNGRSKTVFSGDLGVQYRLTAHYAMGFALKNINSPNIALGDDADNVSKIYSMGLARRTRDTSFALDITRWTFTENDIRVNFGGEHWFGNGLAIRGGLASGSRDYRNITLGGSYKLDGIQFDYAVNYPLEGVEKTAGTHQVSITFRFGKPAPDSLEIALQRERGARLRAEAEMHNLKQKILELMTKPGPKADIKPVKKAARKAAKEYRERRRIPRVPAPPKDRVSTPVKASAGPDPKLLKAYSDSLEYYTNRAKSGASVEERVRILERIIEKYEGKGIDISAVKAELKKAKGQQSGVVKDYKLSLSYYKKLASYGTSPEERKILLERIIKKYKDTGVDISEAERELDMLQKMQ